MDLDLNGCFVQRRKMYIGLPQHNMNSHLRFDWQSNDISVQDQVGLKAKLKQENEVIRKKYTDTLEKKIYHKYVEHVEDPPFAERDLTIPNKNTDDTLTREVEHFNSSKMMIGIPTEKGEAEQNEGKINLLQNSHSGIEKYNRANDRLNQSLNLGENLPSPQGQRQSSQEHYPIQEPEQNLSNSHYRHNRPYYPSYIPNPESYQTISPAPDRYRPYQPNPYANYPSPSKSIQKLATGTIPGPNDYPFRNIIPDKLENHLREKVKADRKALKVSLNLFDYKKP